MSGYYEGRPPKRGASRGWLIAPFVFVAVVFGLYSAYWFWLRGQLEVGVDAWIEDQRRAGLEVSYSDKTLGGYPFRFALDVADPELADPAAGTRWRGERLQLVMDPLDVLWRFASGDQGGKVIGRSPGANLVTTSEAGVLAVDIGRKSALSLVWDATSVKRVGLTLDSVAATSDAGDVAVDNLTFNLAPPPGAPDNLRLQAAWDAISLPRPVQGAEWLGEDLQPGRVALEISQIFPALESQTALSRWVGLEGRVDVAQVLINWGPAKLGLKGDVGLTRLLELDGTMSLRIEDGPGLRAALDEAGLLTEDAAQAIDILQAISEQGLFATASFQDGGVYYLGQRVADAPVADLLAQAFAP